MFARASIPWFIAHELRVTWRTWFQRRRRKQRRFNVPVPVVVGIILAVATGALGVPIAISLRDTEFVATPLVAFIIDAGLLLMLSLMLSQTLVSAVDAFYERGDLDLLLSSPVPPARILAVRAVAMAIQPVLLFGGLVLPFVLPLALLGHPAILAALPMIAALGLFSTGIGLAISIALFSVIGPRRTRTVAQVMAAVVGAAFIIVAQIPTLLGDDDRSDRLTGSWLVDLLTADSFPAFARWPAEAVFGAPVPLLVFLAIALLTFVAVAAWVGRRFARDAAAASGADTVRSRKGRDTARFGGSLARATMAKELRLLRRDPGLLSQVLLRVFYLVPLAVVILTDSGESEAFAPAVAAGAASLLAGQLAGSVAWIAISAEDAPQLLASAPHPIRAFWRAKLATALVVPAVLIGPLMIAFAFMAPWPALIGLLSAAASAWSAAMINLWLQKPTNRTEFRRSWSSTLGANLLELATSISFAAFAGMAAAGLPYAWFALAAAVVVILLARRSDAAVLERLTGAA
jgi:ABC-2 type transport system permease protein